MSPLPNTARTVQTIGGPPQLADGSPIPAQPIQFLWVDAQGKVEIKSGPVVGTQTLQTISNDNDEVLASELITVVAVDGDGSYGLGQFGTVRKLG